MNACEPFHQRIIVGSINERTRPAERTIGNQPERRQWIVKLFSNQVTLPYNTSTRKTPTSETATAIFGKRNTHQYNSQIEKHY